MKLQKMVCTETCVDAPLHLIYKTSSEPLIMQKVAENV